MKRLLSIVGAAALIAIALAAIAVGTMAYKGRALDAESKAFVDDVIPKIAGNWNKDQLVAAAGPELLKHTTPEALDSAFTILARLGALTEFKGGKGEASISYMNAVKTVSASYVAEATFAHGHATFKILLLKRDGHWLIQSFHVDPVVTKPIQDDA